MYDLKPAPAALVCCLSVAAAAQTSFQPPERVTDSAARYRLTRNSGDNAAFDSAGTLHLVYWSGGDSTLPSSPSFVRYRNKPFGAPWSAEEFIDDSEYDTGSGVVHYGGRQPSLAIDSADGVWVTWNDHRHSNPNPPGGGIDNVEIYADYRPVGGSFSPTDIRLTETTAGHLGDNGYLPGIATSPGGVVSVAWHDFNDDFDVSDIHVRHSDAFGVFPSVAGVSTFRLTNRSDRGGLPPYVTADIASNGAGDVAVVWTENFGGAAAARFALAANPVAIATEVLVAPATAGFFDPPKIVVAPDDSFWAVYTDESGATKDVLAARYNSGAGAFGSPVAIAEGAGYDEFACDVQFDAQGHLHAAWIDRRAGRHVYYAEIDPFVPMVLQETQLTTFAATWERPSLALDPAGRPHVVAEEFVNGSTGDVWHFAPETPSSVAGWERWQ